MLIVCPTCATSYQVEASSLGMAGRSVRCTRCGNTWFAANTSALTAISRAHRADVAEFTAATKIANLAADPPPPPPPPVTFRIEETEPAPAAEAEPYDPPPVEEAPPLAPEPSFDAAFEEPEPQPVTVTESPPLAPTEASHPPIADDGPEDIETAAARRARRLARRRRSWPLAAVPTLILLLVAINGALIVWRSQVVRLLPQTASLYAALGLSVNLRGLAFADVTTVKDSHDGIAVLVVEGAIVSTSSRPMDVPRLRFALRDGRGAEVYSWTALPPKPVLAPGETMVFRSRLASPPAEGRAVLVRFFTRRDLVAGLP